MLMNQTGCQDTYVFLIPLQFWFYAENFAHRFYVLPYILQVKPPDWQAFVEIITLIFINSTIIFIEENNAGNVVAALMACLVPKAKVLEFG